MDRLIKKRIWFERKNCYFCKKPASIFRLYKNDSFVLCDRRECNKKWMNKMGMFNNLLELKLK